MKQHKRTKARAKTKAGSRRGYGPRTITVATTGYEARVLLVACPVCAATGDRCRRVLSGTVHPDYLPDPHPERVDVAREQIVRPSWTT